MPLVFACITPHGSQCLPEFISSPDEALATRNAMATLGQRLEALEPDTVVLLTPHGIRIEGAMCISVCVRAAGTLGDKVSVDFEVDQELAHAIADSSDVPTARCIYGASAGPASCIPLDWGAVIPLRWLGHTYAKKPKVVIICPSRALSREQMVDFGQAIGKAAAASGKRVALIASADQAHAHLANGPYGYDPAAAEYDRQMCEAVQKNDLARLLTTDAQLVDVAKPDSLWQMLILKGALDITPMRGDLLSYEVPTYFGLLTASYRPE